MNAAAIRGNVLEPCMEARARNLEQFDPSPETDSLLEHLRDDLLKDAPSPRRTARLAFVAAIIESNTLEGHAIIECSGFADQLAADLHRAETKGLRYGFSNKALAKQLKPNCKILRDPSGWKAADITDAHATVKRVLSELPRTQFESDGFRYEMGSKDYAVLETYMAEVEA